MLSFVLRFNCLAASLRSHDVIVLKRVEIFKTGFSLLLLTRNRKLSKFQAIGEAQTSRPRQVFEEKRLEEEFVECDGV